MLVPTLVNEKRVVAQDEIDEAHVPRTRSDVVPKDKVQIGSGAPPRLSSGLRPAVQLPPPPAALSEEDLVDDDSWDDESGPTLTDTEAPARAQAALQQQLQDEEPEFSHDDFPTRQAPAPLLDMLPEPDSTPELPPPVFSAEDTAQMPSAPRQNPIFELPEEPPPSSISHPYVLPRPITMSGTPMPPPMNVQNAFLRAISPNDDPPLRKLVLVTVLSFLSTLLAAAFMAWIVYLIKH